MIIGSILEKIFILFKVSKILEFFYYRFSLLQIEVLQI